MVSDNCELADVICLAYVQLTTLMCRISID